jgi:branched-chain amino acid transport system ATP-binding protein
MSAATLAVEGLVKRFGGLLATDHVSFDVRGGEVHAIIGPNGAGKTTLLDQLGGQLRADSGAIRLSGTDVIALSAHARAARGIGRSFQITSIFREMTVAENIALAIQVHHGHSFQFFRQVRDDQTLRAAAGDIAARLGLGQQTEMSAGNLAHGEKRVLELAIALAAQPSILLLDEPTAGMGVEESARMIQLLRKLKGQLTIVLIEHDMDVVFGLADRVTVLVYGRVIATGPPLEIRQNIAVRKAYLGDDSEA